MAKRHKTDKRPTITQIALAAGVSISTVSKVLNGRTDVAPTMRAHIEQVIDQYGFVRNRAARALRKGKTGMVDLVLPNLNSDYFLPILQSAEQVLKEAGIRLVINSTHYETDKEFDREFRWIDMLADRSTDGILLVLPSNPAIPRIARYGIPFVAIHNQGGLPNSIFSVIITSWEGGFAATNHLISLGHRRIAYIGKNVGSRDAIERFAGYRTALEVAGIPLDSELQREGRFTAEEGYLAARALMELPDPPTAIFAGNDHHAIGVYQALYELNIRIPEDVSVIGFDNLAYAEHMNPALTTVDVPRSELGRVAATMLLKLITGESLDSQLVVLPTQLLERQSCAPPPQAVKGIQPAKGLDQGEPVGDTFNR